MKLNWKIEFHKLDLRYTWAISRNSSDYKTNAFISVSDGTVKAYGEAAPNIRYNETPELFLSVFNNITFPSFTSPEDFSDWLAGCKLPNALSFGIESAFVHYYALKCQVSVPGLLKLNQPTSAVTSFTIPIMPEENLRNFCTENRLERFRYIKIKVNSENLVSTHKELRKVLDNRIIIDANEAYHNPDLFLQHLELIKDNAIEFVEQPFPAHFYEEYVYLKKNVKTCLFADESITDNADWTKLKECFHGINVKLMKAGGYYNGIRLLNTAREHGMKTMIGCMVETGLGISGGLYLSSLADYLDLDSFMLLKNNPHNAVTEKDGFLFLETT